MAEVELAELLPLSPECQPLGASHCSDVGRWASSGFI